MSAIQPPRAPAANPTEKPDGAQPHKPAEEGAATVLIVEDQEPVLRVAERSLTRAGFQVIATSSPETALELLQQRPDVDVLLSDVVMPKLGGLELAQRVREHRPDLKIVFMSGYAAGPVIEQLLELGGVTTLEKPFRPAELVARVQQVLADK